MTQTHVETQISVKVPRPLRPPVDESTLVHKQVLEGPFWQKIPAYAKVDEEIFLDHRWQAKHSITNVPKLLAALQDLVQPEFLADAEEGFKRAPMSVRVSPYLLSLIDWSDPYRDPLRRQFVPLMTDPSFRDRERRLRMVFGGDEGPMTGIAVFEVVRTR